MNKFSRREKYFLFTLLVANIVLRFPALAYQGLGHYMFCDEAIFLVDAYRMFYKGDWISNEFRSGGINIYVIFAIARIVDALGRDFSFGKFVWMARAIFPLLLSSLAIIPLYSATRSLFQNRPRLPYLVVGAFTISPMALGMSRVFYPDHYIVFFVALFLLLLAVISRDGLTTKNAVLSGVLIGFLASIKYTGLLFIIPLCIWILYDLWERDKPQTIAAILQYAGKLLKKSLYFIFAFLLTFLLWNFSALLKQKKFLADFAFNLKNYGASSFEFSGIIFYAIVLFGVSMGLSGIIFYVFGFIESLRRRESRPIVLLIFPALFLIYMGIKGMVIDRNMFILFPFVLLVYALGVDALIDKVKEGGRYIKPLMTILLLLLLVNPFYRSLYTHVTDWQTDPRIKAEKWLKKNLPPGSVVAHNEFCSGQSPARVAGYKTVKIKDAPDWKEKADYYVNNSFWNGPISNAYDRGILRTVRYWELHYYNFNRRNSPRLIDNFRNYDNIPEDMKIIKEFTGPGPVILIAKIKK